ncbi:MAG TPA: hypothetical protein VHE53_00355, partial [Patescibacteria group bacterium]|nr:hypothetical protein [Patescibacteria group bacterium]
MAKTEQLLEFERERAKQIPSTPSDIEHVQIIFPENVVGLEMLDIGAGVSTVGRELQIRGAKVTTLDRRYDNL